MRICSIIHHQVMNNPGVLSCEPERVGIPSVEQRGPATVILDACQRCRVDPNLPRRCREWIIQKFHIDMTVAGVEVSLQRALI